VTPRNHIRGDGRIGMPDVRTRVDVIDRGGEVKLWCGHVPAVSLAGGTHPNRPPAAQPTADNCPISQKNKLKKVGVFFDHK